MNFIGQGLVGFVVHAENLLADFVGPAGEETSFGWRGPAFDADDAGDIHFVLAEEFEETVAGLIFAAAGDGKHLAAESGEILLWFGAPARDDLGLWRVER